MDRDHPAGCHTTPGGSLLSTPSRHLAALYQWAEIIRRHLPLSKTQALGLALGSIGTVLAESGTLTAAALAPSIGLAWPRPNLIQRLRGWELEAEAKTGTGTQGRGRKRRDRQVEQCAPALGRWILATGPSRRLVRVWDATSIHDRFTVLTLGPVARRCAIPLTWTVVPGNTPGAWQPHRERRLGRLAPQIAGDRFVLVLTDRGLYAPALFAALVRVGWHPLMRIRAPGSSRPTGQSAWAPLADLRPPLNHQRAWTGDASKNSEGRLACTWVAWWTEGHAAPGLLLTDLPVERVQGCWSGLRGRIESCFERLKSVGWDCERTRLSGPERVERPWLALAVALLWTVSAGGQAEAAEEAGIGQGAPEAEEWARLGGLADPARVPPGSDVPAPERGALGGSVSREPTSPAPVGHLVSAFRRGGMILSQALGAGRLIGISWHPEPLRRPLVAQAGFS